MFSKDTILYFDQIREKLASEQVEDFLPLGRSFQVSARYGDKPSG